MGPAKDPIDPSLIYLPDPQRDVCCEAGPTSCKPRSGYLFRKPFKESLFETGMTVIGWGSGLLLLILLAYFPIVTLITIAALAILAICIVNFKKWESAITALYRKIYAKFPIKIEINIIRGTEKNEPEE